MYCKLSKSDGSTRGGVVLIPGETVKVSGPVMLCETGLHFYSHPLLASFFRPIHVPDYATLWEGVPGGEIVHDGQVKSVCGAWKTVRKIDLPEISTEQRVEVAIRCAMQVIGDSSQAWSEWAEDWASGKDRSAAAALEAAAEERSAAPWAAWAEARESAWAAAAAALEAAAAAEERSAWAEAMAAAEERSAAAAAWAAEAEDVDILSIIKNVVGYESEGSNG